MKFQYTFTADLADAQEILFQKYTRIYSRNDLESLHKKLKSSFLEKKSLGEIRKVLTIYKDALASVYSEIEEEYSFLDELITALEDGGKTNEPPETAQTSNNTQDVTKSIQDLTNMLSAMGSTENQHE